MALGDIDRHFAWHAWRLWHWTGSGGALGSPAVAVAVGVAGVALGDIELHFAWQVWHLANRHFAWQAWHLATATFTLSFQNFPPSPTRNGIPQFAASSFIEFLSRLQVIFKTSPTKAPHAIVVSSPQCASLSQSSCHDCKSFSKLHSPKPYMQW